MSPLWSTASMDIAVAPPLLIDLSLLLYINERKLLLLLKEKSTIAKVNLIRLLEMRSG
jgi:hypothetical protein